MKDQLFVSLSEFKSQKIDSTIRESDRRRGGFWTSSFIKGKGSHWIIEGWIPEEFLIYDKGYLFEVNEDSRLFHINSFEKEEIFMIDYCGDYAKLKKEFDGIHLCFDYLKTVKSSGASSHFLSWYTESTWWFNLKQLSLIKEFSGNELLDMYIKSRQCGTL
ncbi:hypothetical protein [Sporolactobacillus laevolacticus]|uniref:Uncharacterized protein n=1 Tax=Sporolactobacillus laevolacticus DSM 442 TaxID=1395513 RepID=V6IXV5_9BACL|nr:hypothetical protein [Sporolactobacillus laevolacticus]EST12192.1 hypothetical protein P343_07700 [Sporolactobacillus laevolacticus DSM 442]